MAQQRATAAKKPAGKSSPTAKSKPVDSGDDDADDEAFADSVASAHEAEEIDLF